MDATATSWELRWPWVLWDSSRTEDLPRWPWVLWVLPQGLWGDCGCCGSPSGLWVLQVPPRPWDSRVAAMEQLWGGCGSPTPTLK